MATMVVGEFQAAGSGSPRHEGGRTDCPATARPKQPSGPAGFQRLGAGAPGGGRLVLARPASFPVVESAPPRALPQAG